MRIAGITLAVLLALALLTAPAAAGDWPGAKKDAAHTSHADEALNPPLKLDWSKQVNGNIAASPVIVEGVLYYTNDTGYTLIAANLTDGEILFKRGLSGSLESTPAVTDDAIIIGAYDGSIYSLRKYDGSTIWKASLGESMFSSPLVDYSHIYIGTDRGSFYAINQATGAVSWKLPDNATQGTPAGDDGKVFIGMLDGNVYALDPETGRVIWSFDTNDSIHSSPMVYDDMVYIASRNGTLYALDEQSGTSRWTVDLGYKTDATPSLDPATGTVFIGTFGGYVWALNATSGDTLWISQFLGPIYATAAVSGDTVYGNTEEGKLFALDVADGTLRWTYDMGSEAWASPAVAEGRLVTGTIDGQLLVFKESAEGPTAAPSPTAKPVSPTPAPAPGAIVCLLALAAGVIMCLRRR
jgi:FOG: WD40-like repeat